MRTSQKSKGLKKGEYLDLAKFVGESDVVPPSLPALENWPKNISLRSGQLERDALAFRAKALKEIS